MCFEPGPWNDHPKIPILFMKPSREAMAMSASSKAVRMLRRARLRLCAFNPGVGSPSLLTESFFVSALIMDVICASFFVMQGAKSLFWHSILWMPHAGSYRS